MVVSGIWRAAGGSIPDQQATKKTHRPFTPYQAKIVAGGLEAEKSFTDIGHLLAADPSGIPNCGGSRVRYVIEMAGGIGAFLTANLPKLSEEKHAKLVARYSKRKQNTYQD